MIRALTAIVLKNSGRSAGWARMYRHPSGRSRTRSRAVPPRTGRGSLPPTARIPAAQTPSREQEADRVGQHGGHRAEQPERGPAERRSERGRGPGGGLEPPVGQEQVLARHERLQVGPAGRLERDVGGAGNDRHHQELGQAEPAERERGGNGHQRGEPDQVHGHHHRPLAAELDPRAERHRDHRPHGQPRRGQHRHLAGPACRARIAISENASNASHVPSVLTA